MKSFKICVFYPIPAQNGVKTQRATSEKVSKTRKPEAVSPDQRADLQRFEFLVVYKSHSFSIKQKLFFSLVETYFLANRNYFSHIETISLSLISVNRNISNN